MRTARDVHPGGIYHVISRFLNRSWLLHDDQERGMYLQFLSRVMIECDWRCFAYALMSSHIHLAFVAGRHTLESWAKRVNVAFASWFNDRHDREGPVFTARPDLFAVPAHREGDLVAYIHNNPVRARVVDRARDSTWTSHRAFVGDAPSPPWLHVRESLARMAMAPHELDAWVDGAAGLSSPDTLATIRKAVRSRGAINVATPAVGDGVRVPLVVREFAAIRPDPVRLANAVADLLGLPPQAMWTRRGRTRTAGRRIAVHLARTTGVSGADIAAALGISRSRASVIGHEPLSERERVACERVLERLRVEAA